MTLGPEYEGVEKPLIAQLVGMGRTHLEGAPPGSVTPTDPAESGRSVFSEVFLAGRLRSQVCTLNRDRNGKPWLDEQRLDQAIGALTGSRGPACWICPNYVNVTFRSWAGRGVRDAGVTRGNNRKVANRHHHQRKTRPAPLDNFLLRWCCPVFPGNR